MIDDFISLLYPRNCVACGNSLYKHEEHICNFCYLSLPKSNFHQQLNNPLESVFYGRVQLFIAGSYYLFNKKGSVQKILHAIKYKSNKELAILVGRWYAKDLIETNCINNTSYIIPVPLHSKKIKMRGYNQSEEFAKGLSEGLNIPLNTNSLKRNEFTTTQTQKSKYERWENVEDAFQIIDTEMLKHKQILLVDDVVTTGATIEACCSILSKIEGIKIGILSIAFAER